MPSTSISSTDSGYLVFVGDITEDEARTIAERLFNT